jgi:hypothetical protein
MIYFLFQINDLFKKIEKSVMLKSPLQKNHISLLQRIRYLFGNLTDMSELMQREENVETKIKVTLVENGCPCFSCHYIGFHEDCLCTDGCKFGKNLYLDESLFSDIDLDKWFEHQNTLLEKCEEHLQTTLDNIAIVHFGRIKIKDIEKDTYPFTNGYYL